MVVPSSFREAAWSVPSFWSFFAKKNGNVYIQEWNFNTTFCAQEISQSIFGDIGYCFKLTAIIKYCFKPL